jgi:hypothetical protein
MRAPTVEYPIGVLHSRQRLKALIHLSQPVKTKELACRARASGRVPTRKTIVSADPSRGTYLARQETRSSLRLPNPVELRFALWMGWIRASHITEAVIGGRGPRVLGCTGFNQAILSTWPRAGHPSYRRACACAKLADRTRNELLAPNMDGSSRIVRARLHVLTQLKHGAATTRFVFERGAIASASSVLSRTEKRRNAVEIEAGEWVRTVGHAGEGVENDFLSCKQDFEERAATGTPFAISTPPESRRPIEVAQ